MTCVLAMTLGGFLSREIPSLLALGLLIVGGAFFSGAETALFALSRGELFRMGQDPNPLRRLVPSLMKRPDQVLMTVLLGTNIMHFLYFVFSAMMVLRAERGLAHGHVWAPVLAISSLLAMIVLGEILPKTLAFLIARRLAPMVAPALSLMIRLSRPVQRGLMAGVIEPLTRLLAPRRPIRSGLSAEEMAALLASSQKRGLLGADETELLQEVLELTDLSAGNIMVPRVDVVSCDVSDPPEDVLALIRRKGVTKVPACEGDLDHVIGVVTAKRLLTDASRTVRELVAPVQFVPETARLERVLATFRATGQQVAMVVDEYGGTAGLITLEDILEEIVGDIADARDALRAPAVRKVAPAEWLIDGNLPVHEWSDAFGTDLESPRFSTVGGLVTSLLGHIPRVGEEARTRNIVFTVEAMRRRRIGLLRVRLVDQPAPAVGGPRP